MLLPRSQHMIHPTLFDHYLTTPQIHLTSQALKKSLKYLFLFHIFLHFKSYISRLLTCFDFLGAF